MQAAEFWDNLFLKGQNSNYSRVEMPDLDNPLLQRALAHFGSVENKTVIDLGCGRGATSLFFAHCGANVISVDLSQIAIDNLTKYCQENDIQNIKPVRLDAQELMNAGQADFVFGSNILHHIEPFDRFCVTLRSVVRPGGKGFFWETNATSKILIWFRQNVVGRLWVPKYGDPDEFPLTPSEVAEIRKQFHVDVEIPELVLFRLISNYLLRGHFKKPFLLLDRFFYRFPAMRKYSYRQFLLLS